MNPKTYARIRAMLDGQPASTTEANIEATGDAPVATADGPVVVEVRKPPTRRKPRRKVAKLETGATVVPESTPETNADQPEQ